MEKIVLLWHNFTSPNRGVSALSIANLKLIRLVSPNSKIYVLGYATSVDKQEIEKYGVECVPFGLKELVGFNFVGLKILRQADFVFDIGEGDSFSDIYGYKRILNQFVTKALARILVGNLYLCPQTYGPFNSRWGKAIAQIVASYSSQVLSRDDDSAEIYESITGIRVERFTDVAFALPYDKRAVRNGVGINVSGLLYNGGYNQNNDFGLELDYKEFTYGIIEYFINSGVKVHLVSHVSGGEDVEDDYKVCLQLKEKYPDVIVAPEYVSPVDIKSYISGLEFFVGARMHATIAAFGAGTPVVPIAYSMKFKGVFGRLGYGRTIDARKISTESAIAGVIDCYANKGVLEKEILESRYVLDRYLSDYKNKLGEVLG